MRKTQAEIKAELLAKYEAMLDEVLKAGATTDGLTLTDIEELALRTRAEVGEQVTTALLGLRREASVPGPGCPSCGHEMRYKGDKHRYLRMRSGDVEVERAYYYCPRCRKGLFPLDEQLALDSRSLSPALAREVVWLSGVVAYAQVSQVLERVGGYHIPPSTLWEHVQQHGERLVDYQARQQRQVSLERTQWETRRYDPHLRKGVSLDGGMVNIRGEGWKEVKTGVVSTLLPPVQQTDRPADAVCQAMHYTAVLGRVEQFAPALWALAVEEQVPYAGHGAVTADGAPWIWTLAADLFPCSTPIVDWYHAIQHLAEAAQARYPTDAQAAQTWLTLLKDLLIKMRSGALSLRCTRLGYLNTPRILRSIAIACCMPCSEPKAIPLAPAR